MSALTPDARATDSRRIAVIWLVLSGATVLSWWLGIEHVLTYRRAASAIIMTIAMVKVRLVIRFFMDVRRAPWPLKFACDMWVVLLGVALVTLYWMGQT